MKLEWIHKQGSSRLILIYAGWSTDASFYSHIIHEGWDVAVAYDYSDLSFPAEKLEPYTTIALFAWSLGVYAASRSMPPEKATICIAINGTEYPADDNFGIPEEIFDGTVSGLDRRNLMKFHRRMAGSSYSVIREKLDGCSAEISDLRKELLIIRKDSSVSCGLRLRWHRAYISSCDAIFPPESQSRAWESKEPRPEISHIEGMHYVDLLPIIKGILPEGKKIGERFHKAIPTYDSQASAQRMIAKHLAEMCDTSKIGNIIEIGPGTGIFTKLLAEKCKPDRIDFIDLYPIPRFHIAPEEAYHVHDAEEWIEKEASERPHSIDAIVSASSIQWFVNPRRFFQNASRLLKKGGLLLCSSFLPGNLAELSGSTPFGLVYRSKEEIEKYLEESFTYHEITDELIEIEFESSREALLHLKHTGVAGGSTSSLPLGRLLSELPTRLSYHPVYMIAKT